MNVIMIILFKSQQRNKPDQGTAVSHEETIVMMLHNENSIKICSIIYTVPSFICFQLFEKTNVTTLIDISELYKGCLSVYILCIICIHQQKASDTWTYFSLALNVNDIISSGISAFITIIILKYGAEYTRLTEARQSVNVH